MSQAAITAPNRLLPRLPAKRMGVGRQLNVGANERAISVLSGVVVVLLGISRKSVPGLLCAVAGGAMIHRGVTGRCRAYSALGIDTTHENDSEEAPNLKHGIDVSTAILIDKPAAELYAYWRDFENLPKIMSHLESVRATEDRRSHWIARAPAIAGGKVEWDAEITRDEPGKAVAWRSLAGSAVESQGEVCFSQAPGDRGTEVQVKMRYRPPAGRLGHWIATLAGEAPARTIREDLRNFKRLMEVGEIPTVEGQSRGTCVKWNQHRP